jgi:transcriptional regulator with XRE-family HTH domain
MSLSGMKNKEVDYKSRLGELLREMRSKESDDGAISQEEYAFRFGINKTYYGQLERGENNISLKKLQDISIVLDIPLSELFKQIEELE